MSYTVLVSKTFQKKFHQLQSNSRSRIRKSLKELEKDPYSSRSNCDIKILEDTKPRKNLLRFWNYRVIFLVERKEIKIIDLLKRETGYGRKE